jgi:hypothetical protein
MTNDAEVDMGNIENALNSLKSSFSGTTAPSAEQGQLWYDTNRALLRHRGATSNWRGVIAGSEDFKVWVYADATEEGYDEDISCADCVIALKGGSQAYNATGGDGTPRSTWLQPSHTLLDAEIPKHTHVIPSGGAHEHSLHTGVAGSGTTALIQGDTDNDTWNVNFTQSDAPHVHTTNEQATGDGAHNHGTSWRPRGAVGIMVYPKAV